MILLLLSGLLGAYVGLTRRGKASAVLLSGAFAAASTFALQLLAAWLLDAGHEPALARRLATMFDLGSPLWRPIIVAMAAAAIAGLLTAFGSRERSRGVYLADSGEWRPERRRKLRRVAPKALNHGPPQAFGDMLNR